MRFSDPATVISQSDLRSFSIRLLTKWVADLNRDKIRLHLPRRRGLMRLIPSMPFHLGPELFLQISGVTTFQFPEETCRVGPGEMCLVSRGLPHREKARPWRGPFFNIVISFTAERIYFHLAGQNDRGHPSAVVSLELQTLDNVHLFNLVEHAPEWSREADPAYRSALRGSLVANLSIILAAIKREPTGVNEPHKVMQVRQLVLMHLSQPYLSANWIGRSLQSSPDYLSRIFREVVGKPIVSYIIEKRMSLARDLLMSSTLNVSEISQATGFDDPNYFTRVFRREIGVTPRQYRGRLLKHFGTLVLTKGWPRKV